MNRFIIFISFLLILYFSYGIYISQYDFQIHRPSVNANAVQRDSIYYDYKGIVNVLTNLSSGASSAPVIAQAARNAGVDFLIFTDFNLFEQNTVTDSYFGNVLTLNGRKVGLLDSKFIYYSKDNSFLGQNLLEAQTKITDLISQSRSDVSENLLILTTPTEIASQWQAELPTGIDGFELFNLSYLSSSAWRSSKISVMWSLFSYPFNPSLAFLRLYSEPTSFINYFDKISSSERPIYFYAGSEATAKAFPLSNYLIKFPSYQKIFEIISNHVLLESELTGNVTNDKKKIFSALKTGRLYLSVDLLGDPKGFYAYIKSGKNKYPIGSITKYVKGMKLVVHLPAKPKDFYEIVIYKNGERYLTKDELDLEVDIDEPATYRVQVRVSPFLPLPDAKKWITWIYTNPFYIKK